MRTSVIVITYNNPRALDIGEEAVRKTAELLSVTESEPVDFFIYGDNQAFRTALGPGTRENVGGQAHADIRTLFGLYVPGQTDRNMVLWLDFGFGFFPYLNEGIMKANTNLKP